MFWTKLAKKSFFPSKIQNENTTIELCDCDFLDQICAKNVFPVSNRNNEDDHWILFIRIGLGTNLQLKLTILTFLSKFNQNGVSHLKQEKWTPQFNSA